MEERILPEVIGELCTGCGQCVKVCPTGALAMNDGRAVLAWPARCNYDGGCELACPSGAIRVPFAIVFGDDAGEGSD